MVKKISLMLSLVMLLGGELMAIDFKSQGKLSIIINAIVVIAIIALAIFIYLKKKDDGGDE